MRPRIWDWFLQLLVLNHPPSVITSVQMLICFFFHLLMFRQGKEANHPISRGTLHFWCEILQKFDVEGKKMFADCCFASAYPRVRKQSLCCLIITDAPLSIGFLGPAFARTSQVSGLNVSAFSCSVYNFLSCFFSPIKLYRMLHPPTFCS